MHSKSVSDSFKTEGGVLQGLKKFDNLNDGSGEE
jgi:hypothetical protein